MVALGFPFHMGNSYVCNGHLLDICLFVTAHQILIVLVKLKNQFYNW